MGGGMCPKTLIPSCSCSGLKIPELTFCGIAVLKIPLLPLTGTVLKMPFDDGIGTSGCCPVHSLGTGGIGRLLLLEQDGAERKNDTVRNKVKK